MIFEPVIFSGPWRILMMASVGRPGEELDGESMMP